MRYCKPQAPLLRQERGTVFTKGWERFVFGFNHHAHVHTQVSQLFVLFFAVKGSRESCHFLPTLVVPPVNVDYIHAVVVYFWLFISGMKKLYTTGESGIVLIPRRHRQRHQQRVSCVWQVGSSGGTVAILRAMAASPSDPELQGEACTALTNLSHNCDRNRRLVVEGGGLVLILNAMQASTERCCEPMVSGARVCVSFRLWLACIHGIAVQRDN